MLYVTERWNTTHTDEDRIKIWDFLHNMRMVGKHKMASNGTYSTYLEDGSPCKRFDVQESVDEYVNFLNETFGADTFSVEVTDYEPDGQLPGRHPNSPYVQGRVVDYKPPS